MTVPQTPAPARLLIAASDDARGEIERWLAAQPGVTVVAMTNHGRDVDAAVRSNRPDIVMAHVDLAEPGPFELLDQLWARDAAIGVVLVVPAPDAELERRALRAGALAVLASPLDGAATDALSGALAEQGRRRALTASRGAPVAPVARAGTALAPMMAVVSAKGGVGRSTVAVNLASVLAQKKRIALCDLDLQFSDASTWGAEQPERTIDHLAAVVGAGEVQLADIQAIAQQRFGAVSLLPGVASPIEGAAWAGERGVRALRLVGALRRWFDGVVVDNLPGLLEPVVGISRNAQLLIVVTTCEVGALRATKRYLGLLDRYAPVPRLIVANRSNRGQSAKLVRAALGANERVIFLKEDRTFARRLVVEGLAASEQRGRGVSRTFGKLAAQVTAAIESR
jgi:pilus assembly protein CpaE